MTILFASSSGIAFINPEGAILNQTSSYDPTFVASSVYSNAGMMEVDLLTPQSDLWIHFDGDWSLHQNTGRTLGAFNTSAGRYDWYLWRTTSATMQFYVWNGSSFTAVGNIVPFSEPESYYTFDFHFTADATTGMLEFYFDSELIASAYGLDTSGFSVDVMRFNTMVSSPVYWTQVIIADEPTIGWKLFSNPLVGQAEGIKFVGQHLQALAGAASGTTDVALNSGLTGGLASSVSPDDYVIAVFAVSSTADRTLSITDGTTAYTLLGTELYFNDNYDINLRVAYKKMGSTPDTFVRFGATGATADAGVIGVYVVRDVDLTTFLDVAVTTNAAGNTGTPNPPALTPVTVQARTLHIGATAHDGTLNTFNNVPSFVDFFQQNGTGTNGVSLFIGMFNEWVSGAVDPAAMTTNVSLNTFSHCSMSIAMRPLLAAHTFSDPGTGVANLVVNSGKAMNKFSASGTVDQKVRGRSKNVALPSEGYEVKAVGVNSRIRRGDTGPQSANLMIRSAKTDYNASDVAISPGFDSLNQVWETDPATSGQWTMDNANKALVGVRSRT